MNWIISIGTTLLTGALGLFLAGLIAIGCVSWYRISGFEGGSGYFVVFTGLAGGVAGLLLGLITSLVVVAGPQPGFLKCLGWSWGIALTIAAVSALIAWLLADIPPTIEGHPMELQVEIKLPVDNTNAPASVTGDSSLTLGSIINHVQRKSETGELKLSESRLENGRWIIPGSVRVFTTRGQRSLSAQLGGTNVAGFIMPLPRHPGKDYEQWSEWMPRSRPGNPPWPDTKSSYRFRIQPILPPPPGPSGEDILAAEAAKEQAAFEALSPDAPLIEWLKYTVYGTPEPRLQIAVQKITARSNFVVELSAMILSTNEEDVRTALRLIPHISQPPKELLPVVAEYGRNLAVQLREVNAMKPADDPGAARVAQVSSNFSAWIETARILHDRAGGDFTPELRVILELSRVREDSHSMRMDIRRVASYYMQQWTGLAPLPGDPPPR